MYLVQHAQLQKTGPARERDTQALDEQRLKARRMSGQVLGTHICISSPPQAPTNTRLAETAFIVTPTLRARSPTLANTQTGQTHATVPSSQAPRPRMNGRGQVSSPTIYLRPPTTVKLQPPTWTFKDLDPSPRTLTFRAQMRIIAAISASITGPVTAHCWPGSDTRQTKHDQGALHSCDAR